MSLKQKPELSGLTIVKIIFFMSFIAFFVLIAGAKADVFNNEKAIVDFGIEKTNTEFIVVAKKGEGATHLAGRVLEEWLKNNGDSLNKEQKIYAEDYLRRKVVLRKIRIGTKISFSKNDIEIAVDKAKKLKPREIENLKKYSLKTRRYAENIISICPGNVMDTDNNIYNAVQIGNQCWLKENLKVTKNPQGEMIMRYCYNNDLKICETDGGLYDWNTAMNNSTTESAQGICPSGWHIPKDSEWYELENNLKNDGQICENNRTLDWDCATAGTKLKDGGSSGFEGLIAGRGSTDSFDQRGVFSFFWSSTQSSVNNIFVFYRSLGSMASTVGRGSEVKAFKFSVRCLKD